MIRFIAWAKGFALGIGGLGLFCIAFLDASVVSLPEVNDILIVFMVTKHPSLLVYYAAMATAGSVAGSLVVYFVGKRGGEALLRKRFQGGQVERTLDTFRRYGVAAVIVPSMLPPPVPFKLFVLGAGVAGMTPTTFACSVGVGRGLRYVREGLLAYYYGEAAFEYLRTHGNEFAIWMGVLSAMALAVYYWRRQRQPAAEV
ncbi:MAG: VTT domain-containing protein [Acidobacteria bacterium]|nr:VTT domain-containing protein [Acidobacteriota bacterium]